MFIKALIKLVVTLIFAVVVIVVVNTGGGLPGSHSSYTIGGTVSGLRGTVVLQNNGGESLSLAANGSFAFATKVASGGGYSVAVLTQPVNQQCTVTNGSGTATANVTSVGVNCVATHVVGVTISGLQGSGLVLGNGGDSIPVFANTYLTFPTRVADGGHYAVVVQAAPGSPRQSCTVINGSGIVSGAEVTDPEIHCVTRLSGVAAAGYPLVGEIAVKDANNVIRKVTTGEDGSYVVDVSDMTAPFLLRATGTVGGVTYSIHSAAVAADLGGNVNITPLTDLIVSNVAGQLAGNYFNDASFAGTLTDAALNAEVELLKQRLLPVLTALGVDAAVDLLRTQFTPLQSELDTALDLLRVSFDPATNLATITNVVTRQQILDNITQPANVEYGAPVMDQDGNLDTVATDIAAVRATLNGFMGLYASGLPSPGSLEGMMDPDFLIGDTPRAPAANALAGFSRLVGGAITDVVFRDMEYPQVGNEVTATVDFTVRGANNVQALHWQSFRVRRNSAGTWLLLGDQRVLDLSIRAQAEWTRGNKVPYPNCMFTGLDIHATNEDLSNDGGAIEYLMVHGPGLPAEGLKLTRKSPGSQRFEVPAGGSRYTFVFRCGPNVGSFVPETVIAAIPDDSAYLIAAYTIGDVRITLPGSWTRGGSFTGGIPMNGAYITTVPKRPPNAAEGWATLPIVGGGGSAPPIVPGQWPFITMPFAANYAVGQALNLYMGGPLTISAAGMNPGHYAGVDLTTRAGGISYKVESDDPVADATGFMTTTLDPGSPVLGSCDVRRLVVVNTDEFQRDFIVSTEVAPSTTGCP